MVIIDDIRLTPLVPQTIQFRLLAIKALLFIVNGSALFHMCTGQRPALVLKRHFN